MVGPPEKKRFYIGFHRISQGSHITGVDKNFFCFKSYFLTPNRILVMKNDFKIHFDTLVMFRIDFGLQKYILNVFWTIFGDFLKIFFWEPGGVDFFGGRRIF